MERAGCATVYQRRAFIASWLDAHAPGATSGEPRILVARYEGDWVLILPLVVERRAGLRVARFVGGHHANHNMPIFRPCRFADLPAGHIAMWLRDMAKKERIDAFVFERQPREWDGHANPLVAALGGSLSPTLAQDVVLTDGFEELLKRHNGASKRKKLKAKEKILKAAGDYEIVLTRDSAECKDLLDVFFQQKSERLRALGISDPFGEDQTRDFFRRMADQTDGYDALLKIAALKAGGAYRAIFGFAVHKTRVSLMVLSFSQDELTRASPGETLLFRLFEMFCVHGVTHVDFGVGRERYKDSWADTEIALYDTMLPISTAGRAYVAARRVKLAVERGIRNNPRLWAGFKQARRLLGGRPAEVRAPATGEDAR
jgi:CelD/BcsL family acetyltransferase involved in cellulose biosynthesis